MHYKSKEPYRYDRNSKSWKEGAFKNQRGQAATAHDAAILAQRTTRYHQFVR